MGFQGTAIFTGLTSHFKRSKSLSRRKRSSWSSKFSPKASEASLKKQAVPNKGEASCPFERGLSIYGHHHFAKFFNHLNPELETADPRYYELALDLMDALHMGGMLVDDVVDDSEFRKGHQAAHLLFGKNETVNRAYTRIFEALAKVAEHRPAVLRLVMNDIYEIHNGQDISLVWRRDGLPEMDKATALSTYRQMAYWKTGAIFRAIGHLVFGDESRDEIFTRFAWCCHLQNDCKNIYSSDYVSAKGGYVEDLKNGEYTMPIILALFASPEVSGPVRKALEETDSPNRDQLLKDGSIALQNRQVRDVCLSELEELKGSLAEFASIWGRDEKMDAAV
ncbi:hypothetical protein AbraIFM66951_005123 [Aspergillus brasiliensis]|uniref:Uncharacterized protein n=1 Tax=Aspergillus brasiliensis TaxID=319629 RepID=A0A9W5YZ67_9EURO|nr:hypothetical protein AbraCBS73388_011845 [Aspergillus brasiliensis]GKZ51187.1 hypothetical protein AbraIFM66951_005123 [Aspergillus brasiliensis]